MDFGNPLNFWLLGLVPLLGVFFLWVMLAKRRALERFSSAAIVSKLTQSVSPRRQTTKYVLLLVGLTFVVLALTAPRLGAKLAMAQRRGVDVVVVLDVSRSMRAQDVKPSRLERAKYQIGQLLDALHGDRVALILFAGQAFVQCPLTVDYAAMDLFLDMVGTDTIPVQGSALDDALELALQSFAEEERQHRVIVVLTDGENHGDDPLSVADRAAESGVRIFALGIGTPEGELIPGEADGDYHKDRRGQYVKTRLDEATLKQMAATTEGGYFRSSLKGRELEIIADRIAQTEQREFGAARFTSLEERYQFPLFVAILCFVVETIVSDRKKETAEWRGRFE